MMDAQASTTKQRKGTIIWRSKFSTATMKHELLKVRTTELGSLYELVYAVEISDAVKQKEFMDEIRCRNGNLDITLTMKPTPAEA